MKKAQQLEYFFALNIGQALLSAAVWTINNGKLRLFESASKQYHSKDDIVETTDRLLGHVTEDLNIEPEKILFGVPDSWLIDDNLKEEDLKFLRNLVKELELKPMAFVATSHALANYFEKKDGVPPTAILVKVDKSHVSVIDRKSVV